MENISLELYKLFCFVAKYGSISKASEALYITQPAVTQGIKRLEEQLNGKLFYRVPKGVVLTENGKKLYEYIYESIDQIGNAGSKFSQYINLEYGKIRIKSGSLLGNIVLYKPLMDFIELFPEIEIEISGGITKNSLNSLSKGEVDLVLLTLPCNSSYNNITIKKLKEEEMCLVATKEYLENIKFDKDKIYEDLNDFKLILPKENSNERNMLDVFFKENNISVNVNYSISSSTTRKIFLLNSKGATIIQKKLVKEELLSGRLIEINFKHEIPKYKIGVAILKEEISNFATLKLLDFIEEFSEE